MKICVFAYNFPHKKSQDGLFKLLTNRINIDLVILADFVHLNITPSKTRVGLKDMKYEDTKKICERYNIPYVITPHNSDVCHQLLKEMNPDLGVILGSRILKKNIIYEFKIGILNLHPGLLPECRGLDTVKWAVHDNLKQGVTSHIIDDKIDRGYLIEKEVVDVYEDDNLSDIIMRIQNRELELMISSINKIKDNNFLSKEYLPEGKYYKSMTDDEDNLFLDRFDKYKKNYKNI